MLYFLFLHVFNKSLWINRRMLAFNLSGSLFWKRISNLICQNMNALIWRHVIRHKYFCSFIRFKHVLRLSHIRGPHLIDSDEDILLLKTQFELLQNFRKRSITFPHLNFANFDIRWYFLLYLLNAFIDELILRFLTSLWCLLRGSLIFLCHIHSNICFSLLIINQD